MENLRTTEDLKVWLFQIKVIFPSSIQMCVCVCVRACWRSLKCNTTLKDVKNFLSLSVYKHRRLSLAHTHTRARARAHTHIRTLTNVYVFLFVISNKIRKLQTEGFMIKRSQQIFVFHTVINNRNGLQFSLKLCHFHVTGLSFADTIFN